jgi:Fe2+ transport system protein B
MQMQKLNAAIPTLINKLDPVNAEQIKSDHAKYAAKKLVGTLVNLTASQRAIERQFEKINELKRELNSPEEMKSFLTEFMKTVSNYQAQIEQAKKLMRVAGNPAYHAVSEKVKQQCEAHIKFYNDNEKGEKLVRHASSPHIPLDDSVSRSRSPGRDRE